MSKYLEMADRAGKDAAWYAFRGYNDLAEFLVETAILLREAAEMEAALREICRVYQEDDECLPGCDSLAHEEYCPRVWPDAVMARIARAALEGK